MPSAILLADVDKLGEKGEVVEVSKGYLRNFLLPRKLAQAATPGAIADVERRTTARAKALAEGTARAQDVAEALGKTVLTLSRQAGEDGRLFGSVTNQDVAEAVMEARQVQVDRRKIRLPEPIKTTGTHMVDVEVADGVTATVKVVVTGQ